MPLPPSLKVTGRFGMIANDGLDPDDEPDYIYCNSGRIFLEPLGNGIKIVSASPAPVEMGITAFEATVDADGYMTWRGLPYVKTPDLTSEYVDPRVTGNNATHMVRFRDMKADGTAVKFEDRRVRIATDTAIDGVCDLVKLLPSPTGTPSPIYRGEPGIGIAGMAVQASGTLEVDLTNGETIDAGLLPVGPGGSNVGVAGYITTPGPTQDAITAKKRALDAVDAADDESPLRAGLDPVIDAKEKASFKDDANKDNLAAAWFDKRRTFLSRAADPASPLDVLIVADSNGSGQGSVVITNRWANRFLTALRGRLQPLGIRGSRGYIPAYYANTSPTSTASGFTPSGAVTPATTYGLGRQSVTLGTGGVLTIVLDCSSFDVVYAKQASGGGVFSVAIDGGAAVNIDTTAAGNLGGQTQRFTPAPRGSHTVVLTQISGTPTIEGLMPYDGDESSGVRLWDGAHFGFTSASFASNGTWSQGMNAFTADLALLVLGQNDDGNNVDPAIYKANIASIIGTLRSKSAAVTVIVVAMPRRAGSGTHAWSEYVDAMREVAASDANALFVDLGQRMPRMSTTDTLGLYDPDGAHLAPGGHQLVADILAAAVLDGIAGRNSSNQLILADGTIVATANRGIRFDRLSGAGGGGRMFVAAANHLDVQLAGGSLRVANNAYDSILFEVSNTGTITIAGGPTIRKGSGSPEGAVTAQRGSQFWRNDATDGQPGLYVKETGTGNTGWVAK